MTQTEQYILGDQIRQLHRPLVLHCIVAVVVGTLIVLAAWISPAAKAVIDSAGQSLRWLGYILPIIDNIPAWLDQNGHSDRAGISALVLTSNFFIFGIIFTRYNIIIAEEILDIDNKLHNINNIKSIQFIQKNTLSYNLRVIIGALIIVLLMHYLSFFGLTINYDNLINYKKLKYKLLQSYHSNYIGIIFHNAFLFIFAIFYNVLFGIILSYYLIYKSRKTSS